MMSPVNESGTVTVIFMIGSSRTGDPSSMPFLKAWAEAILKAISEESTGWKLPSYKCDLHINGRETGQHAFDACFFDAFFDGRYEVPGHRAAHYLCLEFETTTRVATVPSL